MQGVDQTGGGDDRGAVLVVMEDRDVHHLAQPLLDDETVRRLDVLQIDAAEGRPEIAHAVDEFVDVLGADLQVDGIDIGEALEQDRLAFHDRFGGQRAEIAETEDRRAVGDDADQVAAGGVVEGARRLLGDRLDGNRDARRIGERQVALCRHRFGGVDLQLARPAARVELKGFLLGDGRHGPGLIQGLGHIS